MSLTALSVPFIERDDCRLCLKRQLHEVFSLPPTPPANAFFEAPCPELPRIPLTVMQCGKCGHAQLKHVVHPNYLFSDYRYESGTSVVFREHFRQYAEAEWARWGGQPGDLVVEVGSNDGTLLAEFQRLGALVVGVEPALNLADAANKKNIQTMNTYFGSGCVGNIMEGHGQAKLIVANNVLAHVNDLSDIFRAASRLLHKDGLFIFEVQYVGALLEAGLFDMVYHEHLDYHALQPLLKFIPEATNGQMFVLCVEKVNTHGGSIRVTCGRGGLQRTDDAAFVAHIVEQELVKRTNTKAPWALLNQKVKAAEKKLKAQLGEVFTKNPDALVVGYGAPAKATTLLYTMGLTKDLEYVVDDSPLKQGRFMPGTSILVRSSEVLEGTTPPDAVVVLAWNFASSIISKWQSRLPNTKFIVPFS